MAKPKHYDFQYNQNGKSVYHDYASPLAKYQGQARGGCGIAMLDAVFYSLIILALITAVEYALGQGLLWDFWCSLIRAMWNI